ncbi:unnamed protein product [Rotaria sordida]|uniref:Uncharacterized protein n=1 Tax=Rotaria sordida TaxID=392033 RepID=A0A818H8E7_9BILA|nr:unnamed protein product [Rotaria sordida]
MYDINQIIIPNYLKNKNEKLIYIFNFILQFFHNKLKIIEQYKKNIFNELEQFQIKSIDNNENFYFQQIIFIKNEIKINNYKKLLKFIKKFKILLYKLEIINEKNLQYNFLYSKFDRLYEILINNYQINLPIKTNIQFIRDTLHSNKKKLKKEIREFDITRNELLRKLDVLKKKEELKQRNMLTSITEEDRLSSLSAYIQQSEIEPLNIHHEFYAIKIQQITNDLVSMFHNKTLESSLSNMNSFSKTFDHLKTYEQILNKQKINNENQLKYIEDEISIARKYSLFDSLAREQMDNLIRQQNEFTYHKELIVKMQIILNEIINQFYSLFISNFEQDKNQELFKQIKQRAIDTIIQSVQYERLSKRISPHLLVLHKLTSEQELIQPSIIPCPVKLYQLEIKTSVQQESLYEMFHFQYQSSINFQKDFIQQISSLDSIDLKNQILQIEINYLQKQYDESIAIGDFTRQLATEQIISNKLQFIESFQEKEKSQKINEIEIQIPSIINNQQLSEHKKSKTSIKISKINEKSLDTNQVNEQIHELLKNYDKILQKHIQNDQAKLFQTQINIDQIENHTEKLSSTYLEQAQNEIVDQQMINSIENLHQLKKSLEKYHQENNRQKQIDIQFQILDKIDQLDNQSIDHKTIENLRKHLYKEQQGLLILSSNKQTYNDTHFQILPISTHLSESSIITIAEEKKIKNISKQITIEPAISKLIPSIDSVEQTKVSLVTTNAKELYQELEKIKYSIETAFESTQQTSDIVDDKIPPKIPLPMKRGVTIEHNEEYNTVETIHKIRVPNQSRLQSNSIAAMNSSLIPINDILDSNSISSSKIIDIPNDSKYLPSPLTIVGNVEKYSVIERKSKHRQIATSTQRSISQSKRKYGEVYVRHRFIDVNSPISNIDEQRKTNEEKFREKIKRKTRLVQLEKTKQGNTVIHRQVDLSKRVLLIPQRAMYEENLEPIPPLINMKDTTNFTFNQTNTSPLKSRQSLPLISISDVNTIDYHNQKFEMKLPPYSTTILSPVEEVPEEIEISEDIPFTTMDKDSLTKYQSVDTTNKITELVTFDNNEILNSLQEIPLNLSTTIPSVEETSQQKVDENKRVTVSYSSLPDDLSSILNISQRKSSIISQQSKEQKILKKRSSKKKHQSVIIKQIEDVELVPTTNDESLSIQAFNIEQENQEIQPSISITSESKVIYHKVGGKMKKKKKKKKKSKKIKQTNTHDNRIKKKEKKIEIKSQEESSIIIPRKAVPFISTTQDKQIDVEDDPIIKYKKKKRKRSSKSTRKYSRSRSSSKSKLTTRKKNKSKHRLKRKLNEEEKSENIQIESKSIKNKDAITMHLFNVKRFTVPPISIITFDQTHHKYNDINEIKNEKFEQSHLHLLKPMIKNFELDKNFQKCYKEIHNIDAYDLDKELFDFNNDTKEIDQPAMFTEYIPEFFQKQAEEKQIRRISLTAIKTDENFIKRLAPRISNLYNGWQPSDTICAHTDEFRPLNKYFMSDISYYFDDNFIDESGLFQNERNLDIIESRIKQTTQRFRDDYIVKEFFNCWKDYTVKQARIVELRRKRVTIDFREFWFQDAFSDPFYSYFEQPLDYIKKQDNYHQMAYRLHKRLVRTGREQPKDTMKNINRSSFLPILFNLPKNNLDRQVSLNRRRQLINYDNNNNENYLIPLSNLITHHDEILSLIRERINFLNRTKTYINIHRNELAIKELLLKSSLLQQGTIKDLDKLIIDYYSSNEQQDIKILSKSSSNIVKLPMLKSSPSLISKSNSKLSRQTMTISQ